MSSLSIARICRAWLTLVFVGRRRGRQPLAALSEDKNPRAVPNGKFFVPNILNNV